jgi:hypothetical protein
MIILLDKQRKPNESNHLIRPKQGTQNGKQTEWKRRGTPTPSCTNLSSSMNYEDTNSSSSRDFTSSDPFGISNTVL